MKAIIMETPIDCARGPQGPVSDTNNTMKGTYAQGRIYRVHGPAASGATTPEVPLKCWTGLR